MYLSWTLLRTSLAHTKGRLVLIAGAVALGVMLLLTAASFHNALSVDSPSLWLRSIGDEMDAQEGGRPAPDPANSVRVAKDDFNPLMKVGASEIRGVIVDSSATVNAPELYAVTWPAPGEYLVSAGVRTLMEDHPEYQLHDRFGVTDIGNLPQELTAGPDDLLVIRGAYLGDTGVVISDFSQAPPESIKVSVVIMYLGLIVILFPVLLLISISATLGSVQREQRYAALRLVGATSGQVMRILVMEAMVGAVIGYILGLALFMAVRPIFPTIGIDGMRLWANNFAITPLQAGGVAIATIVLVVLAHSWGMRHIHVSPLGVMRRQTTTRKPHWLRLIPLAVSIGAIAYEYAVVDYNSGVINDSYILIGAVIGMMVGLVVASAWLTYSVARISARWARSAPTIIGLTYVQAHASRISRSVSGVVLAVFAGSFFLTAVSQTDDVFARASQTVHSLNSGTSVILGFDDDAPAQRLNELLQAEPTIEQSHVFPLVAGAWTVFDCQVVNDYIDTSCADGVVGVNLWASKTNEQAQVSATSLADFKEHVGSAYGAATDRTQYTVVTKLRDPGQLEQFRSLLARTHQLENNEENIWMFSAGDKSAFAGVDAIILLTYLVHFGIAGTIAVAIISMLVSTYAGLLERRRSLLTLRLSGMQPKNITRMMLIETVGPLTTMLVIASSLGFGAAWVMLQIFSSTLDATFDPVLVAVLICALVLAGCAIVALSPAMRRITQPATNRQE
ncbi:FtsX-like permease family protein [Arcanobacterium phocisimile]|uniref:FtsX-like permease family protein n=1 Tax=Arcanobacterium phocisimile TaxID=1302235 RepID=A0ABX7IHH0_9ACTO|nr:FtsX-like permease family protein [Arcanobacterium phocisimile]QRV02569.1 FtsX-like permease family protein [Arcanobacterium phocisimile]